jgi:methyl-accepting chemotaxis protein
MILNRRRKWVNLLSIEQGFKQRQILRVLGFAMAYVAISTLALGAFYNYVLQSFAVGALPLYANGTELAELRQLPGLRETLITWVMMMTGLSVFFAVATGLYFSNKMAGPVYRFKAELNRIEEGKRFRKITLRKGDDFHDVAEALNRALERMQRTQSALGDDSDKPPEMD